MPVWVEGGLHRRTPSLPHQQPLTQIWKTEFLGRFSVLAFQGLFFLFSWERTFHRAGS